MNRDIAHEVAVLSGSLAGAEEICWTALDLIRGAVPYAAAGVSVWNPLSGAHETLVSTGYGTPVLDHLDNWFVANDQAYRIMHDVDPRPLRWRDTPFPYRESYSAQEVFLPAGFQEGVTTCLVTPDGRYTGSLHVSTDDRRHPNDRAVRVLERIQPVLAGVVDGMRTPAMVTATLGPGAAAIVRRDGTTAPIPHRPRSAALADRSPLVLAVAAALPDRLPERFVWRDGGAWQRVRAHRYADSAIVVVDTRPLPLGLTEREVDVLTGMVSGWTNTEIAASLVVSPSTVAKHVEHVLAKLDRDTRTAAAVRAAQEGLRRL